MSASRRRTLPLALPIVLAVLVTAGVMPASAAPPDVPTVRLLAASSKMEVTRYPGQPIMFSPGVFLASVGGAFEIRARRPDYDVAPAVQQIVHGAAGVTRRPLPSWVAPDLQAIDRFVEVVIRDANGDLVKRRTIDFCPGGSDMRVNGHGPRESSYPRSCNFGPFARGVVWGIEDGWAVDVFGWEGIRFSGENGRYTVKVSIVERYAKLLGMRPDDATRRIAIDVKDGEGGCSPRGCGGGEGSIERETADHHHGNGQAAHHHVGDGHTDHQHAAVTRRGPLGAARTLRNPPASAMPDLIALPAWNIQVMHHGTRDFIAFSATVWNAGPAPLLVEGYRREGEAVMDAYQYFMRGDQVLGRGRVGAFEYDDREGHDHWHFRQFATYSLLDAARKRVVLSTKEAFCLAPTDAIDMTVRGAEWQPWSTGLGSACGSTGSIWIRETLQAGWGDTYGQWLPGQALNITDLPNGTYFVAVEANTARLLHERSTANNVALRRIVLRGSPGHRRVEVAPWHGIDA